MRERNVLFSVTVLVRQLNINRLHLLFSLLLWFCQSSLFAATTNHPAIYKGIGASYAEESQTIYISAASKVTGSNFSFVSKDPTSYQYSGNNVAGFIQYLDASNNLISIYGVASRPVKSGGVDRGLYFYVADSTNGDAPTGEAYLIVFPGFADLFPGTGEIGTSSDPVSDVLNDLLPGISGGKIGSNQNICSGNAPSSFTSVTAGGSKEGAVTYQWQSSVNNVLFTNITGAVADTYTAAALTTTTYYRRVATDPKSNTAFSDTITITVKAATTSVNNYTICAAQLPYTWDGLIFTTAGTKQKTGLINAAGCDSTVTYNLTVNPSPATPTITAGSATAFCAGGSVVLTATAASSYAWYKDGTAISGATAQIYTASASGAYTVVVTNANGCTSLASAATSVTVNPLPSTPTITAGSATTFCAGGSVVLTATASSSYVWYKDGTAISGATAQTYTATASGAYTVVVTNANGCTSLASAATTVTVNPLPSTPTITAGGATIFCAGGSVVLTATAASSYAWYKDGTAISGATAQSYTASASGAYTVVVTNANGCTSSASAVTTVTVNPLPSAPTISAGSATTFCAGGSVVLTATASSSYVWYKDGTAISGATAQTYTANASGAYTVVVTNANGCTSAASAATTVTVNPLPSTPTISAGSATTFCTGGSVVLTATASSSYAWYKNGIAISGANAQTYTATASGAYTVVVTNANGCTSAASAATTVTVNVPPAAPAVISGPIETYPTRTHTYSVTPVAGATSYIWTLPSGWSGSSSTASINVTVGSSNGTISVVAVANGCTSPASALQVKLKLFIADVITPNKDGKNDKWLIMRPSTLSIGVTVYNRWGQIVYKEGDYQNSFDGTGTGSFLGKELPAGTYYFLVDITDKTNGSKSVQKGYLTLKRDY
jgi:gliding motility-associated-like protein